jgi:hypothetical protein
MCHTAGGSISVLGFYLGALLNTKEVCIVAAAAGFFLHLPTVTWNNRHTHGQREMCAPTYFMTSVLLLTSYVNFVLYDANYQTVFSCGMTLNIYAMVRFYYFASGTGVANIERQYDRLLFFAGFSQVSFSQGLFTPLYFLLGLYLWNFYFNIMKPFPKFMMRIERGYWDAIPATLEKKRGMTFEEELKRQMKSEGDKKEAIAKALWNILAANDTKMDTSCIVELYQSWGMSDAKSAAQETFKNVDVDGGGSIDYAEFKEGFKIIIDGILEIGEFEDLSRQRKKLEEKETNE